MQTDTPNKKWISNQEANKVVAKAQLAMRTKTHSKDIQQLMELVSGVENYRTSNHRKQGFIGKIYSSERRTQYNHGSGTLSNNFGIDFDDVISAFWEAVFKNLPKAQTTGNVVNVRVVDGQTSMGVVTKQGGISTAQRPTRCNPINYLKSQGLLGVRNMLNKSYRRHITQVCDDCGNSSNVMSVEQGGENCPKCKSTDTEKFWPSGHSSYRSRKARRCNTCNASWNRQFVRACADCGSENVRTDALVMNNEESMLQQASEEVSVEDKISDIQSERELSHLIDNIYQYLPRDPKNPAKTTHTHDVFNLLTRPAASYQMCKMCVSAAPVICEDRCADPACTHDKVPDPSVSCGAESMATSKKCVNYSKKIGEYHGVSASLASRRVAKVRKYVIQYISTHRGMRGLDTMYELLSRHGLL